MSLFKAMKKQLWQASDHCGGSGLSDAFGAEAGEEDRLPGHEGAGVCV